MILNGQCLKLADEPIKVINTDINCINDTLENNTLMTENIKKLIDESKSILLITSPDINMDIYDYIIDMCKSKNIAIISDNIPVKYIHYQIVFNKSNIEDYDFFGASAGRAPMLINKKIYSYDLIIIISSVIMNAYGGFLGSISTLFNAITAPKTVATMVKYALQDSIYNMQKLSSGLAIGNILYESMRGGLITAGKAINSFSINIVIDYQNLNEIQTNIFAGDTFISQIEAQNVIINKYKTQIPPILYDGLEINIKSYDNIIYFITLIENACKKLKKGGRLLVNINDLLSFGNKTFQEIFYKNTLSEIADNVDESNYMESLYAFILKYYTLNYHIALPFNDKLNPALIQAGLNPLKEEEIKNFLSNCSNKGII